MKRLNLIFIIILVGLIQFTSCRPINIFSPLVDPSKMDNESKLDAGYNAISSGDYEEAIDYFNSVINSAKEEELTEAYLGRASAYMNIASPTISTVVGDLIEGELSVDDTSDVIEQKCCNRL